MKIVEKKSGNKNHNFKSDMIREFLIVHLNLFYLIHHVISYLGCVPYDLNIYVEEQSPCLSEATPN